MDKSDEQLVNQLKGVLLAQGASTACEKPESPSHSSPHASAAFTMAMRSSRVVSAISLLLRMSRTPLSTKRRQSSKLWPLSRANSLEISTLAAWSSSSSPMR